MKSVRNSLWLIFKFKKYIFADTPLNVTPCDNCSRCTPGAKNAQSTTDDFPKCRRQYFGLRPCDSRCFDTGDWVSLYSVFYLKRNSNYYTWTPSRTKRRSQWQYWILVAVSRCCSWCTAVISAVLSLEKHLSQTNTSCVPKFCHQSMYCLIRYFLVRICIAKCFTNNSKQFWCEVMFENEQTFCSWIHHVRTCTAFKQLAWAAA
jgi:hypothetical protein